MQHLHLSDLGCGYEEAAGEEHEAGEHVFWRILARTKKQLSTVKELLKLMRIQSLRCHALYCQNGKKLNAIPVLASRSQTREGKDRISA
ncbi:probable sucrose-phosphate synthase [Cucurbita moschata]|uniref:Probable sucrose-phosphate synthase n=1 Tax=Cucurbita moschata TaxID=3662 RepID=A0A6J1FTN3_CUCMO|nr:probable sucrose-phosphate synthase [Cucurbita moschata]